MDKTGVVAYYRVSKLVQGLNGLGMAAQRASVQGFVTNGPYALIAEFAEVFTGKRDDRKEFAKAVSLCKQGGYTLLIADLSRVTRNASFMLSLLDSGVQIKAVNFPQADRFLISLLAVISEKERLSISERTTAALKAAKARGIRVGNPNCRSALILGRQAMQRRAIDYASRLEPIVTQIRKAGAVSLRDIAFSLNARGYRSPNGKDFKAQTVSELLRRMEGSAREQPTA